MGTQSDYFNRIGYRHTYDIGDRVIGHWHHIPFVGSVGNDRLINHTDGPEVTVHVDLPIKYQDVWHTVIVVKHSNIKKYC